MGHDEEELRRAWMEGRSPVAFAASSDGRGRSDRSVDAAGAADGPMIFLMWSFGWLCGVHGVLLMVETAGAATLGESSGAKAALVMSLVSFVLAIGVAVHLLLRRASKWDVVHGAIGLVYLVSTFVVGALSGTR